VRHVRRVDLADLPVQELAADVGHLAVGQGPGRAVAPVIE